MSSHFVVRGWGLRPAAQSGKRALITLTALSAALWGCRSEGDAGVPASPGSLSEAPSGEAATLGAVADRAAGGAASNADEPTHQGSAAEGAPGDGAPVALPVPTGSGGGQAEDPVHEAPGSAEVPGAEDGAHGAPSSLAVTADGANGEGLAARPGCPELSARAWAARAGELRAEGQIGGYSGAAYLACRAGDAGSCAQLSLELRDPALLRRDPFAAAQLAARACALKETASCRRDPSPLRIPESSSLAEGAVFPRVVRACLVHRADGDDAAPTPIHCVVGPEWAEWPWDHPGEADRVVTALDFPLPPAPGAGAPCDLEVVPEEARWRFAAAGAWGDESPGAKERVGEDDDDAGDGDASPSGDETRCTPPPAAFAVRDDPSPRRLAHPFTVPAVQRVDRDDPWHSRAARHESIRRPRTTATLGPVYAADMDGDGRAERFGFWERPEPAQRGRGGWDEGLDEVDENAQVGFAWAPGARPGWVRSEELFTAQVDHHHLELCGLWLAERHEAPSAVFMASEDPASAGPAAVRVRELGAAQVGDPEPLPASPARVRHGPESVFQRPEVLAEIAGLRAGMGLDEVIAHLGRYAPLPTEAAVPDAAGALGFASGPLLRFGEEGLIALEVRGERVATAMRYRGLDAPLFDLLGASFEQVAGALRRRRLDSGRFDVPISPELAAVLELEADAGGRIAAVKVSWYPPRRRLAVTRALAELRIGHPFSRLPRALARRATELEPARLWQLAEGAGELRLIQGTHRGQAATRVAEIAVTRAAQDDPVLRRDGLLGRVGGEPGALVALIGDPDERIAGQVAPASAAVAEGAPDGVLWRWFVPHARVPLWVLEATVREEVIERISARLLVEPEGRETAR